MGVKPEGAGAVLGGAEQALCSPAWQNSAIRAGAVQRDSVIAQLQPNSLWATVLPAPYPSKFSIKEVINSEDTLRLHPTAAKASSH